MADFATVASGCTPPVFRRDQCKYSMQPYEPEPAPVDALCERPHQNGPSFVAVARILFNS